MLSLRISVCLVLTDIAKFFAIGVVPFCILSNCIYEGLFLHIISYRVYVILLEFCDSDKWEMKLSYFVFFLLGLRFASFRISVFCNSFKLTVHISGSLLYEMVWLNLYLSVRFKYILVIFLFTLLMCFLFFSYSLFTDPLSYSFRVLCHNFGSVSCGSNSPCFLSFPVLFPIMSVGICPA